MPESPAIDPAGPSARTPANPAGGTAGKPLAVAALARSEGVESAMNAALSGTAGINLRTRRIEAPDLAALHALQGDVILLDVDCADRQQMTALSEFIGGRSAAPIVVTSPNLDVGAMRELMHLGVLDVVPQPLDGSELLSAVRQAAQRRPATTAAAELPHGSVITFLAAHGGAGATSLAVQGACALAHGKSEPSVCLLDLNVQFGSAALLLDAEQRSSVIDLIQASNRLDGALLRGAMVRCHSRFDLLSAPATVYAVDDIDPSAITATIATARREYDLTLIDLPLLWSHWTHAALRSSSVIVLVVQLTVPSLRQGRRQLDMLRQEELDDIPVVIVANRAPSGFFAAGGVPLKAATTALGRKVDHVIPESAAMQAAAEAGLPLSGTGGGRSLEKRLVGLMEAIVQAAQPAAASLSQAGD